MLIGFIVVAAVFALQLVFCLMGKSTAVKLIPTYAAIACAIFCAGLLTGLFTSGGQFVMHEAVQVFSIVSGVACIGTVAAWLVYAVIHFTSNRK